MYPVCHSCGSISTLNGILIQKICVIPRKSGWSCISAPVLMSDMISVVVIFQANREVVGRLFSAGTGTSTRPGGAGEHPAHHPGGTQSDTDL